MQTLSRRHHASPLVHPLDQWQQWVFYAGAAFSASLHSHGASSLMTDSAAARITLYFPETLITCGTTTSSPRLGNSRPRRSRRRRDNALFNSLALPNKGLELTPCQIERALPDTGKTPIITSVSGDTPDYIARCHVRLEPLVAVVELNISSPNKRGLRTLQRPDELCTLLDTLNRNRGKPATRQTATLLRFAVTRRRSQRGYPSPSPRLRRARRDALTVANTLPIQSGKLATGAGGLSGKPLLASTLKMIAEIRAKNFYAEA